ncbi:MAG: GNAT family N-acetyltransferase [Paludibacter sp.]|nr:GNAT family N-acetyltransferase [Paludibacter sp.]
MKIIQFSGETEFRKQTGYKDNLNIFFSEDYKNYKLSTKSKFKFYYYLCTDDFVIPIILHKYMIFRYVEFLSEPAKYNNSGESENEFINEICSYLKDEMQVQWLLSTPAYAFFKSYPRGSKVVPFGSQVIDLKLPKENLYQNMDRKHREMTRRGEKGNVKVEISDIDLIDDFCFLETSMWRKSGVFIDNTYNSFYENILSRLNRNTIVSVAYKDEKPQVGLIIYFNEIMAYAMHAGRADEMEPGANNLLYWKMIEYLNSIGVAKFSIVGFRINPDKDTKVYDIQRFKSRFGGVLEEGYMFKMDFKPFYHNFFNLLLDTRSLFKGKVNKKRKDIIDQELHKWKEIQQ